MEVKRHRKIKCANWYKPLVPKPLGETVVIKQGAGVRDTVKLIPKVIAETLEDTRRLAPKLKGKQLRGTCKKIWRFVVDHIRYRKDRSGFEEVRRPARTLWDQIGDCDCMSTLIGSFLTNLKIPFSLRVTKYKGRSWFQHIYVIVPDQSGGYITIDPVVDEFDYEESFTGKMDIPMDLHYLNGPEESIFAQDAEYEFDTPTLDIDAEELLEEDEMEGLGLFRRKKRRNQPQPRPKKKRGFGRVLHAVNKFNPATVLLRSGILAAAKLGVPKKMWEKLLFALVPESEARNRGYNMANYNKVKQTFERVKKIFFGAGGKPDNLIKAMVNGKANKKTRIITNHKALKGISLGEIADDYDENSTLLEILGPEIYNQEIVKPQIQMNGLSGELGAVATGSALAVAMTALGAVAAVVAKIGEVKKGAEQVFQNRGGGNMVPMNPMTPALIDPQTNLPTRTPDEFSAFDPPVSNEAAKTYTSSGSDTENARQSGADSDNEEKPKKGFFRKENMPFIIAGGVGLTALGIWGVSKMTKKDKPVNGLEGTGKPKKRKKKRSSTRKKATTSPRKKRTSSQKRRKPTTGSTKRNQKKTPVNLT